MFNLRQLQQLDQLRPILEALLKAQMRLTSSSGKRMPILVKISPHLASDDLSAIARLVHVLRIDGVIATHTTTTRDVVKGVPHNE
jgi:dihydroorotate dehydrogenase